MNNPRLAPERDIIPAKSSPRFEQGSTEAQALWIEQAANLCCYCKEPLGGGCLVLRWDAEQQAHEGCHQNYLMQERATFTSAVNIEEAAKKDGMTIEGFRALPSWERERRIRNMLNEKTS